MRITCWALACAALGSPGCAGVETDRPVPAASTAAGADAKADAEEASRWGRLEWELLDPESLEVLESGVLTPAAFDFQTRMRRENGENWDPILRRWVSVEEQRNVLLDEYARFASQPRPPHAVDEGDEEALKEARVLWDLLDGASPGATEAIADLVVSRAVKDPDSERVLVRQGLPIAERFTLFASPCPGGLALMLRPDGERSEFSSFSFEHFLLEEDGRHAGHRRGEGRIRVALAEREQADSLVEELHFLTDVDLRERKLSAPPNEWRHRLRIKAGSWIEWPAEAFAPSLRSPQAQ